MPCGHLGWQVGKVGGGGGNGDQQLQVNSNLTAVFIALDNEAPQALAAVSLEEMLGQYPRNVQFSNR